MAHSLLNALVSAKAELSMPKTASYEPGDMGIAANGKAFLVTSSRSTEKATTYKVAFEDGSETSLPEEDVVDFNDMGAENSPMAKLSALVKLALNPDFDLYIKTAIESHEFPIDHEMNWSKWLEATFRTMVAPTNDEVRDEAIHHMLIENLFRYDAIANFDPTRLPPSIQKLPIERQLSSYLKGYFLKQRSDCVEWIKKTYSTGKEMLVLDDAEGSEAFMNNPEYSEEDPGFDGSIEKVDTEKFRKAFTRFVEQGAGLSRPKTKEKVILLLNLILDTPASKPGELIQRLAEQAEVSHSTATKLFFNTLPSLVEKFMKTQEGASLNSDKSPSVPVKSNLEDSSMRQPRFANTKKADEAPKCSQCGQNLVGGICPPCNAKAEKAQAQVNKQNEAPKTGPQVKSYGTVTARTEGTPSAWEVDNERVLPHKEGEAEEQIKITASMDKYATFRFIAEEEPEALSEALIELSHAFSTLAEASEALVENLDLAPVPAEGSVKEKVASRKKFASSLRKLADEAPEKVEDAVRELYGSLDEIASAMENLALNLGIDLTEETYEVEGENEEVNNEVSENEESSEEDMPEISGDEAPAILDAFEGEKESSLRERIAARKAARLSR